jgi:hypothetical protein
MTDGGPKGWLGKADVPDDLPKDPYKIFAAVNISLQTC